MVAIFTNPDTIKEGDLVDYVFEECSEEQTNSASLRITSRSWQDFQTNQFCTNYLTDSQTFKTMEKARNNYSDLYSQTSEEFWGRLYFDLYQRNKSKISGLLDSLDAIKTIHKLNNSDFANMIVTFVQDIPYAYILDQADCDEQESVYGGCLENIKYGILSPIEFLHTLKGDCDTRTVLLYTILKELGYEPKIAVSNAYEHSVLLLNIPSSGNDYVYDKSRKFYFWETTAPGWQAGILPPDMRDIGKWDVVLN